MCIRDSQFVESPDERTAAAIKNRLIDLETAKLADRGDERQTSVNLQEAAHPSIFISGWRPFIGWVCAGALAYVFLLYPFLMWGLAVSESTVQPPPNVDLNALYPLMMGLLGMGGLRTFEKMKKVHRNSMRGEK